ncbi:hypothetical protein CfE428DRAFT_0717 [Chthoniobacter flavus Ellin428]|uniref:Uncharacterized protein n=1 Tax=Chthoniobacter flavus Ellin428 TaxID=497964 RepID=B4CVN0_9BACT|nr:hypothetical protein CfE428DRAFT_0717 [Chthoniobacter flavus Ellin428]
MDSPTQNFLYPLYTRFHRPVYLLLSRDTFDDPTSQFEAVSFGKCQNTFGDLCRNHDVRLTILFPSCKIAKSMMGGLD